MNGELRFHAFEDGERKFALIEYTGHNVDRVVAAATKHLSARGGALRGRRGFRQELRGLLGRLSVHVASHLLLVWMMSFVAIYAPYLPAIVDLMRFAEQSPVGLDLEIREASTHREEHPGLPGARAELRPQ